MKNLAVSGALQKKISMAGLKLKKYSPEILLIGGIVGVVATVVLACRATTKVGEALSEGAETSEKINDALAAGVIRQASDQEKEEKYTEDDAKQDMTIAYVHTAVRFAKLYGPAALLGAVSISSIVLSHNIMNKRNQAVSATLAAVTASYSGYRKRVAERFGDDVERELKYGIKMPLRQAKQTQRPLKQAPLNLPLTPYRREKTTPNGWNSRRPLLLSGSMVLRSNLATTLRAILPTRLTKKKSTES